VRMSPTWLRGAAMLLAGAAAMRTLAWAVHGADFATEFIIIETLSGAAFLFIAARFEATNASGVQEASPTN